jgi:hypothetical protein
LRHSFLGIHEDRSTFYGWSISKVGERTSRRYALGGKISGPVAILLRYMARKNLMPDDVKPPQKNFMPFQRDNRRV